MVLEGSVDSPTWCYFISEIQKIVFKKLLKRVEGLKEEDILLIYDNCSSHVSYLSGWWMRNLKCKKLTICPYTP